MPSRSAADDWCVLLRCLCSHACRTVHQLRDVRSALSEQDMAKVVAKTQGYSGSDMRNLIQEACQGPIRDAGTRESCDIV